MIHPVPKPRGTRLPNLMAMTVLSAAIGLAYFNCDPMIAGSEPTRVASLDVKPILSMPSLPSRRQPAPGEPRIVDGVEILVPEPIDDSVLRGRWALQMALALLERGADSFQNVSDYTFTFSRQERVGGELLDPQVMNVKLRHEPFSLYMKWIGGEGPGVKGRQLIYVEGQNDDMLLIQPGGLAGRLSGTLKLAKNDGLVTRESRHPATECGLLNLAHKLIPFYREDLAVGTGFACELHDGQTFGERPCYLFQIEYASQERNPTYRKSMLFIDKDLCLPTCIHNYTWGIDVDPTKIDEETLLEAYSYVDIQTDQRFAEEDFSKSTYRMR
jgi:hypothetical protein